MDADSCGPCGAANGRLSPKQARPRAGRPSTQRSLRLAPEKVIMEVGPRYSLDWRKELTPKTTRSCRSPSRRELGASWSRTLRCRFPVTSIRRGTSWHSEPAEGDAQTVVHRPERWSDAFHPRAFGPRRGPRGHRSPRSRSVPACGPYASWLGSRLVAAPPARIPSARGERRHEATPRRDRTKRRPPSGFVVLCAKSVTKSGPSNLKLLCPNKTSSPG